MCTASDGDPRLHHQRYRALGLESSAMTCCSRALAVPLVHHGQRLCTEAAGLSDLRQCRPKATNWHWYASMAQVSCGETV